MGAPDAVTSVFNLDEDADIWHRVRSLARDCPPRKGVLFGRRSNSTPHAQKQDKKTTQALSAPRELFDDSRIATAWAGLKVATSAAKYGTPDSQIIIDQKANPISRSFDQLRTRLYQTLSANGWRRVAIASPTPNCGSTYVACNLAASFARISSRRLMLFDLNLRAPGVAKTFGFSSQPDYFRFLMGARPTEAGLVRYSTNVALGVSDPKSHVPAELLHDDRIAAVVNSVQNRFAPDIMLFDLPPMLAYDDVSVFLPQVDGVLLVADATQTTARQIADCERMIAGQTELLGVILNKTGNSGGLARGYRDD